MERDKHGMPMKSTNQPESTLQFVVTADDTCGRLDSFVAHKFPTYSRSFFKRLFEQNLVTVNGSVVDRPSYTVKVNDLICVTIPPSPVLYPPRKIEGDLGVKIVFEHADFLIIFKPAGLLVHIAEPGDQTITLVDWLLNHFHELAKVGQPDRPGIVHRLDKETSGVMVIPRNNYSHARFGDLFKNRAITKTYLALVQGHPPASGSIDLPIARDPKLKNRMCCISPGRQALTHYRVLEQFNDSALVEVHPKTGRTHQIRVHFAAIGHPLIGDIVYGRPSPLLSRQALHANSLSFTYEGQNFYSTYPAPEDFQKCASYLRTLTLEQHSDERIG
jgi:23S rRNA pseudouridine1911/1915/1917 synthase